mmetsp:Transcript_5019/g.7540  ORF Transcript_5019/g.7540 Transcript_5019/m.7540 type:complete len:176 (+) Transcript_5019:4625-5152(+)
MRDEVTNECVDKPVDCLAELNLCPTEIKADEETNVYFDEDLGKCVCQIIPDLVEPVSSDYIDTTVDPLKAYFLSTGDVLVARVDSTGAKYDLKCFSIMTLGPTFMSGLACDFSSGMCLLTTVDATTGMAGSDQCPQIFLDAYESGETITCPSVIMRTARMRHLQETVSTPVQTAS